MVVVSMVWCYGELVLWRAPGSLLVEHGGDGCLLVFELPEHVQMHVFH